MKAVDLTGAVFGRLTVECRVRSRHNKAAWQCLCSCGDRTIVVSDKLRSGHTRSCGCLVREVCRRTGQNGASRIKHGMLRAPEYSSYRNMLTRCYCKKHDSYKDYGGRGVTVDASWRGPSGFENFLADMGPKPSPRHTIERKNSLLGYNKENCVWASTKEQARNRSTNRWITHDGETKILADWAAQLGISSPTLRDRLQRHPIEQALRMSHG